MIVNESSATSFTHIGRDQSKVLSSIFPSGGTVRDDVLDSVVNFFEADVLVGQALLRKGYSEGAHVADPDGDSMRAC
jgi:hypothetical protein